MAEFEPVSQRDSLAAYLEHPRPGKRSDTLTAHIDAGNDHRKVRIAFLNLGRIEIRDAGGASEVHHIIFPVEEGNAWTILISLQSVRAIEAFHLLGLRVETGKSVVSTYRSMAGF